ncbi:outer membrane beta-barrel protein [Flavitalea sp.]|nr:outer membrane beta-barrel protein [Flavitalea sp.]
MKQALIVLCLCIISSTILNAQVEIKPAIGINFTDFSKDPQGGDSKAKLGYQIGGSFAFGKKLYFEPGIFYLKQSTEYTSANSNQADVDYDISGLRIPIAVGYKLLGDENSEFGLRAFGGASAFILTHVKDLDKDDFKSACFGAFLGAGLDISFVFVELQYQWSLTNVQDEDINMIDVGKSRTLFINAGVRLRL